MRAERKTNTRVKAQRLGRTGVKDHSAWLLTMRRMVQRARMMTFRENRMRGMLMEVAGDGESQ